MYQYLAVVWNPRCLESTTTFESFRSALISKPAGWTIACEGPGAFVVHSGLRTGSGAHLLKHNGGVVLGRIFRRRGDPSAQQVASFGEMEAQQIVASGGQHLIDHYWGSYVAIIHDEAVHQHHVLREPTNNLPCYHTRHKGVDVFFSHIEDCVRFLPIHFSVNRSYLARWLIMSRLIARDCGLENVEDVPGGERLTFSYGNITRAFLWNPIEIASHRRFEQPDEAAKALRSVIQETIDAWASCYQEITHKLSGGLDSSIVATCLAQTPSHPRITFLNWSTDVGFDQERLHLPGVDKRTADKLRAISGHGDERHFARLVAERSKIALIERQRIVSMDLSRMWQAPLMINPPAYFTAMESDDIEIEFVKSHGTQAFFSGHAGDSVLLATTQPLPAIDHAYVHGLSPSLWQHLVATSALSRESVWAVFGKTMKHGLFRLPYRSRFRVLDQPTLLKEELTRNLTDDDFTTVWSKLASALPPGKRNHIRGLAGSAHHDCAYYSQQYADHIDPLNSQPIWELMLQIPTYTALTGGVSRGLARRAFADLLPAEVRKRQIKGSGAPFYQQVVRRNRVFLREKLGDGLLVQGGYLDRRKLDDYLAADEPFRMVGALEMLSYMAAEIWLQQWTDISR